MHWRARSLAIATLALAASGCIGATDRADFDAEVRARGGGITSAWIAEGVDLIAAEVGVSGTSEMQMVTLSISPPNRTVTGQARRGDQPNFVDVVTVKEGAVVSITPIQDADQLPLDDITFRADSVPIAEIEALGDTALAEFGEDDGFVTMISVSLNNGEPMITMSLASARRTARALFDASGTFLEVTR